VVVTLQHSCIVKVGVGYDLIHVSTTSISICILAPKPRIVEDHLMIIIVDHNGILCQSLARGQSEIKDYQPTLTVYTTDMTVAIDRAVHRLLF
jgi:hypothetical protein